MRDKAVDEIFASSDVSVVLPKEAGGFNHG